MKNDQWHKDHKKAIAEKWVQCPQIEARAEELRQKWATGQIGISALCKAHAHAENEIAELKADLAEAQAEIEHWKGECSDLVRMAHEMRAEIDYFQTLIVLQHKRTHAQIESMKCCQNCDNLGGRASRCGDCVRLVFVPDADSIDNWAPIKEGKKP